MIIESNKSNIVANIYTIICEVIFSNGASTLKVRYINYILNKLNV